MDSEGSQYDADYFLRGRQTGKSLYEDYRWMPDLTIPMARRMVEYLGVEPHHEILDFGCARGYTVRALRELGYRAWGVDASEWAIKNCDPEVTAWVGMPGDMAACKYDWIIAKDVFEHIPYVQNEIDILMDRARVGVFVVVPLSLFDGARYVIGEYEEDVTHIQRFTLLTWLAKFISPGWRVEGAYRVPGIKDNWYRRGWERANGFITARRVG